MAKQTKQIDCGKCLGRGTIRGFSHVVGGVCFSCGGSGKKTVRADYEPSLRFGCVYAGELLFWVKARSYREAVQKAVAHWKRHSEAPAFAGVTEAQIAVVPE